jgi:two-component system response regulator FixJ
MKEIESIPHPAEVWIVDSDSQAWRSVMRMLNSIGITARAFGCAEEVLKSHKQAESLCVLTELLLPDMNGLELLEQLAMNPFPLTAIVVTSHAEVATTVRSLHLGALTVLEKPCNELLLLDAVRDALKTDQMRRQTFVRRSNVIKRIDSLDERERQVIDLILSGFTNKAMARKLDVSIRTIEARRQRIFRKLSAKSLPELVTMVHDARCGCPTQTTFSINQERTRE